MGKRPPISLEEIKKYIDNLRETFDRLGGHGQTEMKDRISDTIRRFQRTLKEDYDENY
jgi:hypothetical protein